MIIHNYYTTLIKPFFNALGAIWHYSVITLDNNDVRVSNIIMSLIAIYIGVKYYKIFINWVQRLIAKWFNDDKYASIVLQKLSSYVFIVVYGLFCLQIANISLSMLAFIGGALVLGIGFGIKNLVSGVINSLVITFERPLRIGDIISVDNYLGYVISIGIRSVAIETMDDTVVFIPNSKIIEESFTNFTNGSDMIKLNTHVVARVAESIDDKASKGAEIIQILQQVMHDNKLIASYPAFKVWFISLKDQEYEYLLQYFCSSDKENLHVIKHEINLALNDKIPYNISVSTSPKL